MASRNKISTIRRCDLLAFSPDGKWIAYGYNPTHVWSVSEKKVAQIINGWNLRGISLAWAHNSRQFAIGNVARGCYLFELVDAQRDRSTFQMTKVVMDNATVSSIAFHPNGRHVLVGDQEQRVNLIDHETWQTERLFRGHLDFVSSLDWHPEGDHAISAGLDGAIKIWNSQNEATLSESKAATPASTNDRGKSPDGLWNWRVANRQTVISRASTGEVVATIPEPYANMPHRDIHFFPQANRVILSNNFTDVESWNTETWQQEGIWSYRSLSKGVQITSDMVCMVQGGNPPWHITLIDTHTLESRTCLPHHQILKADEQQHRSTDLAIRLNPDSTRLMTASSGEVKIWDTSTLRETHTTVGHVPGSEMYSGVWSNTGKYIASRCSDHTAKIWEAETGRLVTDIRGHQATVSFIKFSDDDSRVLTVGYYAKLWDIASGREILTTNEKESPAGKHSHEHVPSDFDTPLIRDFFVHNSKEDFALSESALRFDALQKAIRHRRKADGIDEFQHASLNDLAYSLASNPKSEHYDPGRSIRLAKRAVAMNPSSSDYHTTLALTQIRNEEFEAAIQSAKTSTRLAPDRKLRNDLLIAYGQRMLGRNIEARETYNSVNSSLDEGQALIRGDRFFLDELAPLVLSDDLQETRSRTTISVNTLHDEVNGLADGNVSLREAVWMAKPNDRIEFSVEGEIQLQHGPIEINQALEIVGPGADQLTIRAAPSARIFTVTDDESDTRFRFELSGMRLTGGREIWSSDYDVSQEPLLRTTPSAAGAFVRGLPLPSMGDFTGGAIFSTEDIEIRSVLFEDNLASFGAALRVSVGNRSTTILRGCAFRNNGNKSETHHGGALNAGGGELSRLLAVGCEFSGNRARAGGAVVNGCEAKFENCTFSSNVGEVGSVMFSNAKAPTSFDHCTIVGNRGQNMFLRIPIVRLSNSILVDNTDENGSLAPLFKDAEGKKITAQHCILDVQKSLEDLGGNLFDVDPMLGPLADNGGLVRTHALLPGSPAIDAGTE